jgi:hypothetical protein
MSNRPAEWPPFDLARARAILGKTVLMALRYVNEEGSLIERKQLYGVIIKADEREGVDVRLSGSRAGEVFKLPPDTRSFEDARAGKYTLKSTGEVVENPDLILTASIREHERDSGGLA